MTFRIFLELLNKTKALPSFAVICFATKQYPLLFSTQLLSFLKKQGIIIERCNIADCDADSVKAHLSMENLSGAITYWLDDFFALSPKKQQEWLATLQCYTGPHVLVLFCSEEAAEKLSSSTTSCVSVTIGDLVPSELSMLQLLVNTTDAAKQTTNFIAQVAARVDRLSVDNACLLMHYDAVLGKNNTDFFTYWFGSVVESRSSLFLLAQHFFAKKSKPFFHEWAQITEQYPPQFWVTFWSDQVWRAHAYCTFMQQRQHTLAKKAQYKLPFSFINRDWSLYNRSELSSAHNFLYDIDFLLKNGGNQIAFEHFFCLFFENGFKNS